MGRAEGIALSHHVEYDSVRASGARGYTMRILAVDIGTGTQDILLFSLLGRVLRGRWPITILPEDKKRWQ